MITAKLPNPRFISRGIAKRSVAADAAAASAPPAAPAAYGAEQIQVIT